MQTKRCRKVSECIKVFEVHCNQKLASKNVVMRPCLKARRGVSYDRMKLALQRPPSNENLEGYVSYKTEFELTTSAFSEA